MFHLPNVEVLLSVNLVVLWHFRQVFVPFYYLTWFCICVIYHWNRYGGTSAFKIRNQHFVLVYQLYQKQEREAAMLARKQRTYQLLDADDDDDMPVAEKKSAATIDSDSKKVVSSKKRFRKKNDNLDDGDDDDEA